MSWLKSSDTELAEHLSVSDSDIGMLHRARLFMATHSQDPGHLPGHISRAELLGLPNPERADRERQAERWVQRGEWQPSGDGWNDPRYLAFNDPEVIKARVIAGSRGGERSVESRRQTYGTAQPRRSSEANPEANPEANSEQSPSPSPYPFPSPISLPPNPPLSEGGTGIDKKEHDDSPFQSLSPSPVPAEGVQQVPPSEPSASDAPRAIREAEPPSATLPAEPAGAPAPGSPPAPDAVSETRPSMAELLARMRGEQPPKTQPRTPSDEVLEQLVNTVREGGPTPGWAEHLVPGIKAELANGAEPQEVIEPAPREARDARGHEAAPDLDPQVVLEALDSKWDRPALVADRLRQQLGIWVTAYDLWPVLRRLVDQGLAERDGKMYRRRIQ